MTRTKAFTIIEFFTAAAVAALLAALLRPITAQAQWLGSSATTASNLAQIGRAANMYSADYDGQVVNTQWGANDTKHWWAVSLLPYVSSQSVFFDPIRTVPTGNTVLLGTTSVPLVPRRQPLDQRLGVQRPLEHSRRNLHRSTLGLRVRPLARGHREPRPANRLRPHDVPGSPYGWSVFHSYESNWINTTSPSPTYIWNNMVYNTNALYSGGSIPVVHADGSAGKLTRGDFKDHSEVTDLTGYCAWMSTDGQNAWDLTGVATKLSLRPEGERGPTG